MAKTRKEASKIRYNEKICIIVNVRREPKSTKFGNLKATHEPSKSIENVNVSSGKNINLLATNNNFIGIVSKKNVHYSPL